MAKLWMIWHDIKNIVKNVANVIHDVVNVIHKFELLQELDFFYGCSFQLLELFIFAFLHMLATRNDVISTASWC